MYILFVVEKIHFNLVTSSYEKNFNFKYIKINVGKITEYRITQHSLSTIKSVFCE